MKNLLLTLAIIATVNFNAQASSTFLNSYKVGRTSSSVTLDIKGLKDTLASNQVVCFSFKRKSYISKGYKTRFGNNTGHCSTKRAKMDGVTKLNKDNLTTEAFLQINKS